MRGGTGRKVADANKVQGLSPHARGNQLDEMTKPLKPGPIPACAGEPLHGLRCISSFGAYPRMRGGTATIAFLKQMLLGLSPHARGNRLERIGLGF